MFVYLALFQALKVSANTENTTNTENTEHTENTAKTPKTQNTQKAKKKPYIILAVVSSFLLLYAKKIYTFANPKTKSFQFQKEIKEEIKSSVSVLYSAAGYIFKNDKEKNAHAGSYKYLIENSYLAKYDYVFTSVKDFNKLPQKDALLVLSYWDDCMHEAKISKILLKKNYVPYKYIRNGPECYLIYFKKPYKEGLKK